MPATRPPRYQELARELRDAVRSGAYAPGAQLPTEAELTERHGVSRFTVREALRRLQAEGLIKRRRGSGTVVADGGGSLRHSISNVGELLQYAHGTRFRFEARGLSTLTPREAAALGRAEGERWLRFEGRRTEAEDGAVIGLTHVFILPDLTEAAAQIGPTGEAIFEQLERLAGVKVTQVTQDIRAVAANAAAAGALGLKRGAACLEILRCYMDADGRLIEMSLSLHPGDRFRYSMHTEVE